MDVEEKVNLPKSKNSKKRKKSTNSDQKESDEKEILPLSNEDTCKHSCRDKANCKHPCCKINEARSSDEKIEKILPSDADMSSQSRRNICDVFVLTYPFSDSTRLNLTKKDRSIDRRD